MLRQWDQTWQDWLQANVARHCDKDELAQILFDNGFDPLLIVNELQYLPQSLPLILAMNQRLAEKHEAMQEVALLQQLCVALDAVKLDSAKRLPTAQAHMYKVDDFLSAAECEYIIQLIRERSYPSTITSSNEPDKTFRTSSTCALSLESDPLIEQIDQRIADYMGMEVKRSEGIQGQYYQVGQQFKTHTDFFEPGTQAFQTFAVPQGQRTWTFMIYLNNVPAGGETQFPRLGLEFKPQQGQAVIWNNLYADGRVNPDTAHWAKPVEEGEKYVITKWFRTFGSLAKPFERCIES
ncbi:MAG: proline hydroxylase [Proteobacteria bacterium]|nr:MAG: proline hydroxylase [Pseudomonadota bacterium]